MSAVPSPVARQVALTFFRRVTDPQGEEAADSFQDLAVWLASPCTRPANAEEERPDLGGWAAAKFRGAYRNKENTLAVSALVFDLDTGNLSLEQIRAAFPGRRLIVHPTRKWRARARRWRVVVEISRDLTLAEQQLLWFAERDRLAALGVAIDESAKDGCRFWFAPCGLADGAEYVCTTFDGAPFDVDAALAALVTLALAPPRAKPIEPRPLATGGGSRYGEAALEAEVERIASAVEGSRHGTIAKSAFKIGQLVGGAELDEGLARARLVQASEAVLPPNRAGDARRTVAGQLAAGARAPRVRSERPRPNLRAVAPGERGDERPVVHVDSEIHRVTNEAEVVLARDPSIYQRGGVLVRVVHREDDTPSRVHRAVGTPRLHPLTLAGAVDTLSSCARWEKFDARAKGMVPCSPPPASAAALLDRGAWPNIRPLAGVATIPILRGDGSVCDRPGYDAATRVLVSIERADPMPTAPTREDALAARDRLLAVVGDFPFVSKADVAAWLALPLTIVCRAAIDGPVPAWVVSANVKGAGKSRLVDVASLLCAGRSASRATFPATEEEVGKVLTSIALEGDELVLFDNVAGSFGGAKLDAWATGERWTDRLLGTNRKVDLPIRTILAVSGNNVLVVGDTLRRVLPVRLESEHENPEERDDFELDEPLLEHVRARRDSLARDVVTIAAAWFAAGRPKAPGVKPWGSFEGWSSVVPHILRWVDLEDPMGTREGLEHDDPRTRAFYTLFDRWRAIEALAGTQGVTARELVDRVVADGRARPGFEDVAAALEVLAPGRGREPVDVRTLGYALRSAKRRRFNGKRLEQTSKDSDGIYRWTVR